MLSGPAVLISTNSFSRRVAGSSNAPFEPR